MPGYSRPLCLWCQLFDTSGQSGLRITSRNYATRPSQLRRPARELLSSQVSRPDTKAARNRKAGRRGSAGPFAILNKTSISPRATDELSAGFKGRSDASQGRRATSPRHRNGKAKSRQEGEYKALKMQQTLSSMPYQRRNAIKEQIQEITTFEQFHLLPIVQEAIRTGPLQSIDAVTPTPIQRVAIPALLDRKVPRGKDQLQQFLLAAETGSGKTLAYMLPLVDHFKRDELIEHEILADTSSTSTAEPEGEQDLASPRIIVLVPTAELVAQVTSTVKALCHTIKFRVAGISSSVTPKVIYNRVFGKSGVDILIATPHLLNSIAKTAPKVLSQVKHLVIDEADSLFDRSFAPETIPIIDRASPSLEQLILCSATIPRSLDNLLRKQYPSMKRLVTPNLHTIPRRVQLGVVEVDQDPYRGDKRLACADTIWTIGKSSTEHVIHHDEEQLPQLETTKKDGTNKHIIVFVNERTTAKQLTDYLRTKGIDATNLSREITEDDRLAQTGAIAEFSSTKSSSTAHKDSIPTSSKAVGQKSSRQPLANTKVLVATDLGSRGIDTIAVRYVILYDCPHTTIDFIHRLGRTGRMGRRGRGVVLLSKGDRRDIVKEVREGMFMGKALI